MVVTVPLAAALVGGAGGGRRKGTRGWEPLTQGLPTEVDDEQAASAPAAPASRNRAAAQCQMVPICASFHSGMVPHMVSG